VKLIDKAIFGMVSESPGRNARGAKGSCCTQLLTGLVI